MSTGSVGVALGMVVFGGLNGIQFFRKRWMDIGIGTVLVRETVPGADRLIDPVVNQAVAKVTSFVLPDIFLQVRTWAAGAAAAATQIAADPRKAAALAIDRFSNLTQGEVIDALPAALTAAGVAYTAYSFFTGGNRASRQPLQIEQICQIIQSLRSDQIAQIHIDANGGVFLTISARGGIPSAG